MFRVVVHRRAARYLQRQPQDQQTRLKNALRQLGRDPGSVAGAKPMHGEWQGYHRLRVGDLRVIYLVDREEETTSSTRSVPGGTCTSRFLRSRF